MSEVIETEAEVIDVPETMGRADRWLADLAAKTDGLMAKYGTHDVETEADYRDIKSARTMLRKDIAAIDAERKANVKSLEDALAQFRNRCNVVTEPLTRREAEYKRLLDGYDERWQQGRMDYVREAYEDYAPQLVGLVPYERIAHEWAKADKWMLRSVTDEGAADAMRKRVDGIAKNWATLDNLDMTDEERKSAKDEYLRTLDIESTIQHVTEGRERRARIAEIEAAREATERREQEVVPVPEPAPEPEPEPEPSPEPAVRQWVMAMTATREQAEAVARAAYGIGATGRIYHGSMAEVWEREFANG